jgi:membrane associated rhomboid family serine protease
MNQKPPIYLIVTLIASGALAGVATALGSLLPQYATWIAGVLSVLVAIAGLVKTYYDLLNSPAPSVAINPKTGNVAVAHPDGTLTGATVVTTTSTEPIVAPQKT